MLKDDWEEELKAILDGAGKSQFSNVDLHCIVDICTASQNDGDHIYMMFSATFPKEARQLAKKFMADDHVRIRVGRAGSAHANILQKASLPLLVNYVHTLTHT